MSFETCFAYLYPKILGLPAIGNKVECFCLLSDISVLPIGNLGLSLIFMDGQKCIKKLSVDRLIVVLDVKDLILIRCSIIGIYFGFKL